MGTSGLARHLLQDGILTNKDIAFFERNSANVGPGFARILIAAGVFTEESLAQYLASVSWAPLFQSRSFRIPQELKGFVDRPIMESFTVAPFQLKQRVLTLLIADPLDQATLLQLKFFLKFQLNYKIATFTCIHDAIQDQFPDYVFRPSPLEKFLSRKPAEKPEEEAPNLALYSSESPPIIHRSTEEELTPTEPESTLAPENPNTEDPLVTASIENSAPPTAPIEEAAAAPVETLPEQTESEALNDEEALLEENTEPVSEDLPLIVHRDAPTPSPEEIPEVSLANHADFYMELPDISVDGQSSNKAPTHDDPPLSTEPVVLDDHMDESHLPSAPENAAQKSVNILGATLANLNFSSSLEKSLTLAQEGFEKAGSKTGWIFDVTGETPQTLVSWGSGELNETDKILDLKHGAKPTFWIPVEAILPQETMMFEKPTDDLYTLISTKDTGALLSLCAWPKETCSDPKFNSLSGQILRSLLQQTIRAKSLSTQKTPEADAMLTN